MARSAIKARDRRRLESRPPAQVAGSPRVHARDDTPVEGSGGAGGIVLPMHYIGDGLPMAAYTVTAYVGPARRPYPILVDSGSSDLWLAATDCGAQVCSTARAMLYDSAGSVSTGKTTSVGYLVGQASGPIVWDRVELGGYTIDTQALIAATDVQSEPLSDGFSGILGLALESTSQISAVLPSVTSDEADGAPFWSNMFGAEPNVSRFFSVSLERPGFDTIPSLLGIGMHPSSLVKDPADIHFYDIVPGDYASSFWRLQVRKLTAYVDGVPHDIELGRSKAVPDAPNTVAVFDTGGPVILASTNDANAIYGAFGINPPANSDGYYYMPCSQMLNLSITIGRIELPIHPLDLSYSSDPASSYCTGAIVASDTLTQGDMILGVPFLRNVYSVLQYSESIGEDSDDILANPRLGLMSLTNASQAITEWHSVRIDHVPLKQPTSTPSADTLSTGSNGKKLSVGIEVVLGIVGFFVVCAILFIVRWFLLRRRFAAEKAAPQQMDPHDKDLALALAGAERYRGSRSTRYSVPSDVMTLHTVRYDEHGDKAASGKGSYGDADGLTPRSSRRSDSRGRDGDRYSWVSADAVVWPQQTRDAASTSPERVHQWQAPDQWRATDQPQLAEVHPTDPATGSTHSRTASTDSAEEPKTANVNDPLLPAAWPTHSPHVEPVDVAPQQFAGVGTFANQNRRQSTARSSSFTSAPTVMSPLHAHRPLVAPSDTDERRSSHEQSWDSGGENGHDRT